MSSEVVWFARHLVPPSRARTVSGAVLVPIVSKHHSRLHSVMFLAGMCF